MRITEWINLFFFSFFIVLAWSRPLAGRQRTGVITIGAVGIGLVLAVLFMQKFLLPLPMLVARDWLPALFMLLVYWQSGQFFKAPNEKFQAMLERLDNKMLDALLQRQANPWNHPWIAAYLELAYLLCYPLIPLGVGVLYMMNRKPYVDEYWVIVLLSAYLCYVTTTFIQTLPPRMLVTEQYFSAHLNKIRTLNLRVLRHTSIQVNTFPSAHVAATIAASLALLRLIPMAGLVFLWISISIAVGTVMGRYHYAADALTGIVLAIVVFLLQVLYLGW